MISEATTLTDTGFFWLEKNGVRVLVSEQLQDAGFSNGFSTRVGGVSKFPEGDLNLAGFGEDSAANIASNRHRFMECFDPRFRLTTVWQVHGDSIKNIVDDKDIETTEDKHDGLVSRRENVLLGVKTADCVPVLIGDPVTGAFASIHAGWRGTVASILPKTLNKMEEQYGSKPSDVLAAIGPAAGCDNYEVGAEVIEEFHSKFPYASGLFKETKPSHALIDLHKANKTQLLNAGVKPENISVAPFCTIERVDLFFSYRVEKRKHGKTGRLMSVIGRLG